MVIGEEFMNWVHFHRIWAHKIFCYYTGGHNYVWVIIGSFIFFTKILSLGVWFKFKNFQEIKSTSKEIIKKKYSKFLLQHFKNKLQKKSDIIMTPTQL